MKKIYTKKGDKGKTQLIGSYKECQKSIPRVEAYGTVDELASFVGLLHDSLQQHEIKQQLKVVLHHLFTLEAYIAIVPDAETTPNLPKLEDDLVQLLETWIDEMENSLPPLTHFILPIGHPTVSLAHVCRTIARRAERRIVAVHEKEPISPVILAYMNRLSDYFFVLARYIAHVGKIREHRWPEQS